MVNQLLSVSWLLSSPQLLFFSVRTEQMHSHIEPLWAFLLKCFIISAFLSLQARKQVFVSCGSEKMKRWVWQLWFLTQATDGGATVADKQQLDPQATCCSVAVTDGRLHCLVDCATTGIQSLHDCWFVIRIINLEGSWNDPKWRYLNWEWGWLLQAVFLHPQTLPDQPRISQSGL